MKKFLFLSAIALMFSVAANAQIVDNFDSNKFGWLESTGRDGEAVIKNGVLHMKAKEKAKERQLSTCYIPVDMNKSFEIKANATVKNVNDDGLFGVIFNYMDDYNYCGFFVGKDYVLYHRWVDNKLVGSRDTDLPKGKKYSAKYNFSIKSEFGKVSFYINGALALEVRYIPMLYSGFGFYVAGKQVADFDNLEIIQ